MVKENAAFIMAVSPEDRLLINAENGRRAGDNLPALTLDQMSDYLTKSIADKLNSDIYTVGETSEQVYNVRPQERGRARPRGGAGGYGQPRGGYPPRGGYNPQPEQRPPNQRGAITNGRYLRGNNRSRGNFKRFVTNEMAKVDKYACLMCGQQGHTFKDETCIYHGFELMQSACRFCHRGAHPSNACKVNK